MNSRALISRNLVALLLVYVMVLPGMILSNEPFVGNRSLTEEQKVLHVLDRLGFGARPGDVERIKAIGLQRYIDQQLDPASINDPVAESKVGGLEVFSLSTAELFAKYPNPGALLRQLEGRQAQAAPRQTADGKPSSTQDPEGMNDLERRERRQKLAKLYREYDLRPAAQILPQITANRVLRAVYSERQLQEVMVDFWQNHFNVFAGKAAVRWYIPSYERDVLRKYALGNFKDLVIGTARHPAMLFYLDNFESVSPNSQVNGRGSGPFQRALQNGRLTAQMRERIKRRQGLSDTEIDQRLEQMKSGGQRRPQRGINENYARELMELHTLGVDGGYTQKDIVEVARAFTGWTIADPRGYRRSAARMIQGENDRRLARLQRMAGVPDDIESGEFYFNERWHEKGAKTVLGQQVDEGGVKDGLKVIDILVSHPSTAKFIARKLAVKFVSDKPGDGLVDRVAKAFQNSKGDIRATLRALFNDREFFAPANYRSKIKTPFELAISSLRALGADTNGGLAFVAMLNKLGEMPYGYQAPTGYPDTAEDWVNTGALLERLNFAVAVASNRIPGTRVDLKAFAGKDRSEILKRSLEMIIPGEISPGTRATLLKQIEQPLPEVKPALEPEEADAEVPNMRDTTQDGRRRGRQARLLAPSGDPEVFKIVSLVLGTPDFQRQ